MEIISQDMTLLYKGENPKKQKAEYIKYYPERKKIYELSFKKG